MDNNNDETDDLSKSLLTNDDADGSTLSPLHRDEELDSVEEDFRETISETSGMSTPLKYALVRKNAVSLVTVF